MVLFNGEWHEYVGSILLNFKFPAIANRWQSVMQMQVNDNGWSSTLYVVTFDSS